MALETEGLGAGRGERRGNLAGPGVHDGPGVVPSLLLPSAVIHIFLPLTSISHPPQLTTPEPTLPRSSA